MSPALFAWAVTVAIEAPCVALLHPEERWRMGATAALATSLTNVAMNLYLPRVLGTGTTFLMVGETGAVVLEALVYIAVSRRHQPERALAASALANAASFGAGLLLPWTL